MHVPHRIQRSTRCRGRIALAITVVFAALALGSSAQQDPGTVYLDGYLLVEDAEKLTQQKSYRDALSKYNKAKNVFDAIAHNHPTWRPEVVAFRRRKVNEAIAEVKPFVPGAGRSTTGVESYPPRAGTQPYIPPKSVGGVDRGSASNALLKERDAYIRQLQSISEDQQRKLARTQDSLHQTLQTLKKSELVRSTLTADLKRTQTQLSAADNDPEKIKRLEADVKRLNNELAIAGEALEATNKRNAKLQAELTRANDTIASLTTERDELKNERARMEELLKGAKDGDVKQLLAENQQLQRELADTKKEVKRLAGEKKRDTAQIAALRERLTTVESRLAELQKENSDYEKRIASLSSKLRSTEANLEKAAAPDGDSAITKAAIDENETLRKIVRRQIMQQNWRKQAKELVIAQLRKRGADSQEMLRMIENLANQGAVVTKQEQDFLNDSMLKQLGPTDGQIIIPREDTAEGETQYPELAADNSGQLTEVGLNDALTDFARAIAIDFARKNYAKCQLAYQEILQRAPDNLYTLRNLGIVKMRLGKAEEAEELFKRAITTDASDGYSHFILGVLYYREGLDDLAFSSMDRGLSCAPGNAKAHHYLGAMCIKRGLRERARQEFQSVIAIDPTYGDAYYNLAYLCVTDSPQQLDQARNFYHQAQKNGTTADPAMDRALGT